MLGKIEGRRGIGQQRMRWLEGITDSLDMNLSIFWKWRIEEPGVLQPMGSQSTGHNLATEQQQGKTSREKAAKGFQTGFAACDLNQGCFDHLRGALKNSPQPPK